MPGIHSLELKQVTKLTLTDSVAESLRSAIFGRMLRPGQRIPEAQFASKLGVSRAPVRDALAVLLQEGLVHRDQRGAVVTQLSRADVDEISQLRLALERLAITLAIRNASDEQLANLAENIRRTARASAVGEAGELDLKFHELLVRAANNRRLLDGWLALRGQIRLLLLQMDHDDAKYPRHTADAHGRMLQAMQDRNEGLAVQLLEQQLENTHQHVAEHYDLKMQIAEA
ncbi:MAG: GntR family transcriptional regulator [Planctomycetia bacterium]|nr:GntR family transcriptional regulator [Planctomycetia bacterium]